MGYDMYWRDKPAEAVAVKAAAEDQFKAAVRERDKLPKSEQGTVDFKRVERENLDPFSPEAQVGQSDRYRDAQARVHAAYEAMFEAEVYYFRANIWGMGRLREIMAEVGMVFDAGEHPGFPKAEAYGAEYDDLDVLESPEYYPEHQWDEARLRATVQLKAAQDEALDWHGPEVPGIPVHKFGSNDGWHVLPAEAEAALRIWQQFTGEHGEDAARNLVENHEYPWERWLAWLAYLAGSMSHGGFEVH